MMNFFITLLRITRLRFVVYVESRVTPPVTEIILFHPVHEKTILELIGRSKYPLLSPQCIFTTIK